MIQQNIKQDVVAYCSDTLKKTISDIREYRVSLFENNT